MYLSGVKADSIADELAAGTIGLLKNPAMGNTLDGVKVWALDNGAFTNRYPGDDEYMATLEKLSAHRDRCLFVAVCDVVGDAVATLALFEPMARRIRAAGWPVALVGQDGMQDLDVPWELCDWLFIGGSTEWKLSSDAARLIRTARARGKRVHVGRVNSGRRFAHFAALDCDSSDGTLLAFGPEVNAPRIRRWMNTAVQPALWGA